MNTEQILMCVVALILGMLLANMLKSVCGCKNLIEGQCSGYLSSTDREEIPWDCRDCIVREMINAKFDGTAEDCDFTNVWVNGHDAGEHPNCNWDYFMGLCP